MGEKHLSFPRAAVTTVLWGHSDFPLLGLGNAGKKSHFFNIFLLLLLDAQCHFQLQASMSVVTCSVVMCCDPVGQTQCTEDAGIKCTVLGEHVGSSLVKRSWVMRLQ